jgi:hypothetical protein
MQQWLPVIATLAGAIVAGVISFVLHIQSNKHANYLAKLHLSEERARWATEHTLERIQKFYGTIDRLLFATGQFRIQQAWEADPIGDEPPPKWVLSYNDARGNFEDELHNTKNEISLLDEEVQKRFNFSNECYMKWFLSKNKNQNVEELVALENHLHEYKTWLSAQYRAIFSSRRNSDDV